MNWIINKELIRNLELSDKHVFFSKVSEELSELMVSWHHYHGNKAIEKEVIEEVADVLIQLNKVMHCVCKEEGRAWEMLGSKFYEKVERLYEIVEI